MPRKKKETKDKVLEAAKGGSNLDVVRQAIRKKYGNVVTTLGERGELKIPSISSGSLGLDAALGRGGFAQGRVYEVFGEPSGGKTTLTMSVIAEAQKRGMNCVFVDAEHCADPNLFEAMNVDVNKLEYVNALVGDTNLNVLEMLLKSNNFSVAVVDSVSALIPKDESEANMEDQFMGLLARLMSKALRKFVPIVAETNTLLIFINQIRYKIAAYGDPTTTTGGEALNFYSTGRIKVGGGANKKTRIVDPVSGEVIGHKTSFNIVKNKLAAPFKSAEIPLIYGVGYDSHWECLTLAESLGVLGKNGAWYSYNDENIAQGELNAVEFLKENEDVYRDVRSQVIEALGLGEYYEQPAG